MMSRLSLLATLLAAAVAAPLAAQRFDREPRDRASVSFLLGAARYDILETGTSVAGGVRLNLPSGRFLSIEPGFGIFRYTSQLDETITYILPEVSVQVRPHTGSVRPYAGAGIGFSEFLSGRGTNYFTLHAVAGLVAMVGEEWGVRTDLRARTIDPFRQKMVELTVGVTRHLGR